MENMVFKVAAVEDLVVPKPVFYTMAGVVWGS
jgi:hypothetical protein